MKVGNENDWLKHLHNITPNNALFIGEFGMLLTKDKDHWNIWIDFQRTYLSLN